MAIYSSLASLSRIIPSVTEEVYKNEREINIESIRQNTTKVPSVEWFMRLKHVYENKKTLEEILLDPNEGNFTLDPTLDINSLVFLSNDYIIGVKGHTIESVGITNKFTKNNVIVIAMWGGDWGYALKKQKISGLVVI